MKTKLTLIFALLLSVVVCVKAQNQKITVESVQKTIVGKWKVLSLQKEGEALQDFSKDNYVWEFTADCDAEIHSKELGKFSDWYKVVKARFKHNAILIIVPKLVDHGFTHEKFVVREISKDGNTLLLGDWDDKLLYKVQRVE